MADWFYKATNTKPDYVGTLLPAKRGFLCRAEEEVGKRAGEGRDRPRQVSGGHPPAQPWLRSPRWCQRGVGRLLHGRVL